MDKVEIQKIKTGLDNYRFSYLSSYTDLGSEVVYTHLSSSPSGLYYIVESDNQKTKIYKRFSDAIKLFNKRADMSNVWIDLEHDIDWHHDTIDMDDLYCIELDDLGRL